MPHFSETTKMIDKTKVCSFTFLGVRCNEFCLSIRIKKCYNHYQYDFPGRQLTRKEVCHIVASITKLSAVTIFKFRQEAEKIYCPNVFEHSIKRVTITNI